MGKGRGRGLGRRIADGLRVLGPGARAWPYGPAGGPLGLCLAGRGATGTRTPGGDAPADAGPGATGRGEEIAGG